MIKAVCQEANRIYRLFCQRNKYFERNGGQVSIIGHSLGAVLAMDILSAQDTFVPPLKDLSREGAALEEHFVFNTHSLFLCKSTGTKADTSPSDFVCSRITSRDVHGA